MAKSRFEQALQALIISLLIHVALTVGIYLAPEPKNVETPLVIELIDSKVPKVRQIVDNTKAPEEDILEKLKDRSQLLSKYNKRVKKEQVARNKTGETKNRRGMQGQGTQLNQKNLDLQPKANKPKAQLGQKKKKMKINPLLNGPGLRGSLNDSLALGESTSGFDVPGVKGGNFTSLNTDQFTYYSFFERVNQSIRYRWISGVRRFAREAPPRVINSLARVPAPTVLRVLLDREGMVVKVDVLSSSGAKELDAAAVEAFYQASPLNHPPTGMIKADRMVHLNYSFKVHFSPVYMAKGIEE